MTVTSLAKSLGNFTCNLTYQHTYLLLDHEHLFEIQYCHVLHAVLSLFHLRRPPFTPIWQRYLDALLLMDPQLSHGALRLFLGLPVLPASITLDAWNVARCKLKVETQIPPFDDSGHMDSSLGSSPCFFSCLLTEIGENWASADQIAKEAALHDVHLPEVSWKTPSKVLFIMVGIRWDLHKLTCWDAPFVFFGVLNYSWYFCWTYQTYHNKLLRVFHGISMVQGNCQRVSDDLMVMSKIWGFRRWT